MPHGAGPPDELRPPVTPAPWLDAATIHRRVAELAADISAAHPAGLVAVVVLPGSVLFASDLLRRVSPPCVVDVVAAAPGSPADRAAPRQLLKDLDTDVTDQDVVVIDALVDTGRTLDLVLRTLQHRGARSVEVCALLARPGRQVQPLAIAHLGFAVGDEHVIGYGLDFAGRYRNLDRLVVADLDLLGEDPDAYRPVLYPVAGP